MRRARSWVFIGIAAFAIVASACSSKSDSSSASSSGGVVRRIAEYLGLLDRAADHVPGGRELHTANPGVSVSVDGPGTGDGFALFCKGETDISDASRPIKDEEAQACKNAGINYMELEIGLDGITVMTNPANAAVDLPEHRRPLRAVRPGVRRLRHLVGRECPRHAGRRQRRLPGRAARRSRRRARSPGPTTRSSSSPDRRQAAVAGSARGQGSLAAHRLPVQPRRQRDHPGRWRAPTARSDSSDSRTPSRTATA